MKMIVGHAYKWKHTNFREKLIYTGMVAGWHQFTKEGKLHCEVVQHDLHLMEKYSV